MLHVLQQKWTPNSKVGNTKEGCAPVNRPTARDLQIFSPFTGTPNAPLRVIALKTNGDACSFANVSAGEGVRIGVVVLMLKFMKINIRVVKYRVYRHVCVVGRLKGFKKEKSKAVEVRFNVTVAYPNKFCTYGEPVSTSIREQLQKWNPCQVNWTAMTVIRDICTC